MSTSRPRRSVRAPSNLQALSQAELQQIDKAIKASLHTAKKANKAAASSTPPSSSSSASSYSAKSNSKKASLPSVSSTLSSSSTNTSQLQSKALKAETLSKHSSNTKPISRAAGRKLSSSSSSSSSSDSSTPSYASSSFKNATSHSTNASSSEDRLAQLPPHSKSSRPTQLPPHSKSSRSTQLPPHSKSRSRLASLDDNAVGGFSPLGLLATGTKTIEGNRESRVYAQQFDSSYVSQPVYSSARKLVNFISKSAANIEIYTTMEHKLGLTSPVIDVTRADEARQSPNSKSKRRGSGLKPNSEKRPSLQSDSEEERKRFRSDSNAENIILNPPPISEATPDPLTTTHDQNVHTKGSDKPKQGVDVQESPSTKPSSSSDNDNSTSAPKPKPEPKSVFGCPTCPVYRPTVLEFSEPLDYIASIRAEAQKFGICKIIPPEQWKPNWDLANKKDFAFSTRRQVINQLYTRYGPNCHFLMCLREHLHSEGITLNTLPKIGPYDVDLFSLSKVIASNGGLQHVINRKKWGSIAEELHIPKGNQRENRLQGFYYKYLLSYDMLNTTEKAAIERVVFENRTQQQKSKPSPESEPVDDAFGFEFGDQHTLQTFQSMADKFKEAWFKGRGGMDVSAADIEEEYWKIVEDANKHVSVSYGSDIDTTKHGSGFSTDLYDPYSKFGWNLNVLPGLEGSILKHVSGISGISMPWLYIGMLFSSFCWHNEDNYLYSINYHHVGAPKQWYGIPGRNAPQVEASFRRQMPDEFSKRPLLMHDLVTMVSPAKLMEDGVPMCSTVQEPGQFVVTFPRSYHGGFSLGFNCGEAVNFAAADWIPFGLQAIEDYSKQRRPVSLNQEQLILNTAKHETNKNTLRYTLPELLEARSREAEGRMFLVKQGIRQTTFAQFTGGLSRELGNIFQPRSSSKMSAPVQQQSQQQQQRGASGRMQSTPVNASVNSQTDGEIPSVCDVCFRVCHLSMVVLTQSSLAGNHTKSKVRCLPCMKNDTTLGSHSLSWQTDGTKRSNLVLVCRYSLDELDELILKVKSQLAQID